MKLDNFSTGRCRVCGTVKQFQPGKEYSYKDFMCKCDEVAPVQEPSKLDKLKELADRLEIPYRSDIKYDTLKKKVEEVQNGNQS